jgi:hypothetical protein
MACPITVRSPDLRLSYTTRVWLHIKALRSERRFGEEPRVLRSLCDDEATTYPGLAVGISPIDVASVGSWGALGVIVLDVPSISTNTSDGAGVCVLLSL